MVRTKATMMPISGSGPPIAVPPASGTQSGSPRVGRRSPRTSMITAGRAMNSPWAKLIAPAVCHSRANPTAARAKIAPVANPEKLIWRNVDT